MRSLDIFSPLSCENETPLAEEDGAAGLEKIKDTFSCGLKKLSVASHVIIHTQSMLFHWVGNNVP